MNPPAGATASLNASGPVSGGMNPPEGATASLNASGPVSGGMNPPEGATASLNTSPGEAAVQGSTKPRGGGLGWLLANIVQAIFTALWLSLIHI